MKLIKELIPVFQEIQLRAKFFGNFEQELAEQAKKWWIPERVLRKQYDFWIEKKKADREFRKATRKNILTAIEKKLKVVERDERESIQHSDDGCKK